MVASRLDRRLAARLDPSDIVQETLAEAATRMDDYLKNPTLPFFGWLRLIATDHILDAHRQHMLAQKRSISRERRLPELTDESAVDLVHQLMCTIPAPATAWSARRIVKKSRRPCQNCRRRTAKFWR